MQIVPRYEVDAKALRKGRSYITVVRDVPVLLVLLP